MIFGKRSSEGAGATVGELRTILDHLQLFCASISAKSAAKDLEILSAALEPHTGKRVDAFCAQARAWFDQAAAKPKGPKKAPGVKKGAQLSDEAIRYHVAQLRNAGNDRQVFETAFERLQADKSIKSSDVAEIARQYADSVTKYKSISAARSDIFKAFIQQARFANKLR